MESLEIFNGFDFVFFLRESEGGMLTLDLIVARFVLAPDVFLHALTVLAGGLLGEGVTGTEFGALLDEFMIGGNVIGVGAESEVVGGVGGERD